MKNRQIVDPEKLTGKIDMNYDWDSGQTNNFDVMIELYRRANEEPMKKQFRLKMMERSNESQL
jgi:hypothetical protein